MAEGFFRECSNPDCRFRYPDLNVRNELAYCPKCGESAEIASAINPNRGVLKISRNHPQIIALLDNIRSVYNVGSIIRSCEGFGIKEIILAGISPTPDHPRMNKTGLGSIPNIKWRFANNGIQEIRNLKEKGFQIISLENTLTSMHINQVNNALLHDHLCLVVGNENLGIDPEIQKLSDFVIAIPMAGEKESFNVSVAFGIAAYHLAIVAYT
jgi:23S rRNA (guanosine2251-2'-O)-methyltransferase